MLRLLSAALACFLSTQVLTSPDGAITRGPVSEKAIALVFTGHEFAEGGDVILNALARRRARASFFLTGDFLRKPEFARLTRRLVADGHYLGPHSDKHLLYCDWDLKQTLVTRQAFRDDLEANLNEVARFGVVRKDARYFLPAYEWANAEVAGWARELGMVTVNYTPGTRSNADYTEDADPRFVASREIVESILRVEATDPHGLNGFLLLMHIGAGPRRTDKTHGLLDGLLGDLASRSYRFVRVDELLAATQGSAYR